MVSTKTARQRLRNHTRYFDYTLGIYRGVLELINRIAYAEWPNLVGLRTKEQVNLIEHLIHGTAKNAAVYQEFDTRFYKFPSYLRRAAIAESLGHVASHMSLLQKWEEKKRGKAPVFRPDCHGFPVFYKGNMSEWICNGKVKLKVYNGSDWIWFTVPFEPVKMSRFPVLDGWMRQNPSLIQKGKRWSLHIPFVKTHKLPDKDFERPVLSVDLGLSHTAVCSVVYPDGTVTHREFLNYAGEKDRLDTLLGQVADKQRKTWLIAENERFCKSHWDRVSNIADEIAHQCSTEVTALAKKYCCQTIVFEHLGKLRVPKHFHGARRLRKKLHYWMQGRIQRFCRYKANAEGIRFSKVLARGTSQYAFDGSGEVKRNGNKRLSVFATGKTYNADLSASYNIGARYWIRELQNQKSFSKSLSSNVQVIGADVSSIPIARHQQTLASLISLVRQLPTATLPALVLYSGQGSFLNREAATIAAA